MKVSELQDGLLDYWVGRITEQPALFPGVYLDAINRQGETA